MIFMTPPPQGLCTSGVGFFKSEAEADAALSLRSLCRPHSTDLKPVKTELPTYPNAAREQNIRGQVAIQILVSEAGHVEGSQVISGDPLLRDAALEAAKRWRFKPFLKGGQPVAAIAKLSFDF